MSPSNATWTPGAHELELFREDVYLRIVGTTAIMTERLNRDSDAILDAVETPAAGALHPERADFEYGKGADLAEHERFAYNWALVMLSTRTIDTLKHLVHYATWVQRSYSLAGCSTPAASRNSRKNGELEKLTDKFQARFNICLADAPGGIDFLEGMRQARNKIVHNAGSLYELSSDPNPILTDGEAPCPLDPKDQEFVERFGEYAAVDRITVTKELFEQKIKQCLAFVEWVTGKFDQFIQLLSAPAGVTVH